jgi:hypothetical protein
VKKIPGFRLDYSPTIVKDFAFFAALTSGKQCARKRGRSRRLMGCRLRNGTLPPDRWLIRKHSLLVAPFTISNRQPDSQNGSAEE